MPAIMTWPLARFVGHKAWIGLGVFGGLLAILTLAVLFGPSSKASNSDDVEGSGKPEGGDRGARGPGDTG